MRGLPPHTLSPRALPVDLVAGGVLDLLVPEVRHTDLAARVELDPGEVSPIGDWYLGEDDRWHHSSDVPAPDPTVTAMLPAVTPTGPAEHPAAFDDPASFPSYDHVDSLLIRTIGAPA